MMMEKSSPAKPRCKLTGIDGNVFALAGEVIQALRKMGQCDKVKEFVGKLPQCKDYDDALSLMREYVDVH